MLAPFFRAAMVSPPRQRALRKAVSLHILLLGTLGGIVEGRRDAEVTGIAGQMLVALAIVEASVLGGWRLTQLPKSQALEFLLTSPVQPRRLFLAEALVGFGRFALVHLSGLPLLLLLVNGGALHADDLWVFFLLPFIWGLAAALGLIVWSYETIRVKRIGEVVAIAGVGIYLVVGVLAAERLREWLLELPTGLGQGIFQVVLAFHENNPFGVIRYWMQPGSNPYAAWEMFTDCALVGILLAAAFGVRAAFRLRGHFGDRHYRPFFNDRPSDIDAIGERPLSWWAVKRVMEFSGRVNIWLAGGFSTVYAAYILAGDDWPPYLGKLVFEIFEKLGGVPVLIAGLVTLSAVPAAFQYGLWDSTTQDRCRRMELLLLTELDGRDYWNASLAAAVKRGRGYLMIAAFLWVTLFIAGRIDAGQLAVSVVAGLVVWAFAFLFGFLAFSGGYPASGLGSTLTLGMPLAVYLIYTYLGPQFAMLLPLGAVYATLRNPVGWTCLELIPLIGWAWYLRGFALERCDPGLRKWYDANQGVKAAN